VSGYGAFRIFVILEHLCLWMTDAPMRPCVVRVLGCIVEAKYKERTTKVEKMLQILNCAHIGVLVCGNI